MEMYKDRFEDASDFTFIFIGNINLEEAKPLFEEYLGSLPAINRKETFRDNKMDVRQGVYKNEFIKQQETAKASAYVMYSGTCAYNERSNILMSMVEQVLTLLYTEKVREDEGGTYGVRVDGGLEKYPKEIFTLQIVFETDPAKKDRLMEIIYGEIDNMIKNGPSDTNLNKAKEYMLKKHKENLKENGYWLGVIDEHLFTGVDMEKGYEEIVNSITTSEIRTFAEGLFKQNNKSEVTMISPEKK